ncbi:endonuclease/exonuclease/phosphatase family protein [Pseudochrobactrum sp. HB0163]|uniref:endonuclease/exonuclease/phosphatase family protein n=1 Tax=Pseudochrobactrum sp. HB0163 TaxID=3450708 RepID=UPI003F6E38D7
MRKKLHDRKLPQTVLKAIRNRRGHRPLSDNNPHGDTVIASYNVHKCIGIDKKFNPDRTAQVIAELNADIVAIQEADKRFGERSGLLNLQELERNCGLLPVPIQTMSPSGHGWHGNLLLIRQGLVRNIHQVNLPGVEPRGAVIADIDLDEGPLRVIAAHFGLLKHSRSRQAETLLSMVREDKERPTILIGDLNEWRVGKGSSLATLQPVFNLAAGAVPSFPSRFPVLALDRILSHPQKLVTSVEVHNTPLSRIASDHLPIKAHLNLKALDPAEERMMPVNQPMRIKAL